MYAHSDKAVSGVKMKFWCAEQKRTPARDNRIKKRKRKRNPEEKLQRAAISFLSIIFDAISYTQVSDFWMHYRIIEANWVYVACAYWVNAKNTRNESKIMHQCAHWKQQHSAAVCTPLFRFLSLGCRLRMFLLLVSHFYFEIAANNCTAY